VGGCQGLGEDVPADSEFADAYSPESSEIRRDSPRVAGVLASRRVMTASRGTLGTA